MLEFNSQQELERSLVEAEVSHQAGLHLALLRGHPILIANTLDPRVLEWKGNWCNLGVMTLSSERIVAPPSLQFSALAIYVTLWQGVFSGATYLNVSDFFDFFDQGTTTWLNSVIARKLVNISIFVQSTFIDSSVMELGYQGLLPIYQSCLEEGLHTVDTITDHLEEVFKGENLVPSVTSLVTPFERVKSFLFDIWPSDPFKTFTSPAL